MYRRCCRLMLGGNNPMSRLGHSDYGKEVKRKNKLEAKARK